MIRQPSSGAYFPRRVFGVQRCVFRGQKERADPLNCQLLPHPRASVGSFTSPGVNSRLL